MSLLATLAQPTLQHPRDAFQSLSGLLDAIQPRLNLAEAKKEVDDLARWANHGTELWKVVDSASARDVDELFGRMGKTL